MMCRLYLLIFCITLYYTFTYAHVATIINTQKDPRYCYTTTHNIGGIEFGKWKRISHLCATAKCERNGNIQITGCSPIQVAKNCKVTPGKIQDPYPNCCHNVECHKTF